MMTLEDFYSKWTLYMADNPKLRKGQSIFNLMYDLYPQIANKYRATNLDPFYNDENINHFIEKCLTEINKKGI